jgi:hypothetical protein
MNKVGVAADVHPNSRPRDTLYTIESLSYLLTHASEVVHPILCSGGLSVDPSELSVTPAWGKAAQLKGTVEFRRTYAVVILNIVR